MFLSEVKGTLTSWRAAHRAPVDPRHERRLAENGMPRSLVAVALVESGFRNQPARWKRIYVARLANPTKVGRHVLIAGRCYAVDIV